MSYSQPTKNCPYCDMPCVCDWVDVGVGSVQRGPYFCENCEASEIGPYDTKRLLTDKEKETGWYEPGTPVSETANTFRGKLVSHHLAKALHRLDLLDKK